jgi:hypothetical protein
MRRQTPRRCCPQAILVLAFVAAGCGGKPANPGPPALCRIPTSVASNQPLGERRLPAPFWFSLMVRGYQSSGAIARPPADCEGQPIQWTADACAADAQVVPIEAAPLGERDLVVSNLGDGQRLVWVQTEHYTDGEAVGPVALAVLDARGASVTTLGVLRAYASHAQLRLERLGDGQILVAEGEACADESDARSCVRGIRIVPVGKRRFVPLDVSEDDGRCQGRAFFPLRAEGTIGEGNHRKSYRIQSSINFAPDAITIQEQLTIGQTSANSADAAASALRRMTAERKIRLLGGRLVAEGPSLLDRWARQERASASSSSSSN